MTIMQRLLFRLRTSVALWLQGPHPHYPGQSRFTRIPVTTTPNDSGYTNQPFVRSDGKTLQRFLLTVSPDTPLDTQLLERIRTTYWHHREQNYQKPNALVVSPSVAARIEPFIGHISAGKSVVSGVYGPAVVVDGWEMSVAELPLPIRLTLIVSGQYAAEHFQFVRIG